MQRTPRQLHATYFLSEFELWEPRSVPHPPKKRLSAKGVIRGKKSAAKGKRR